MGKNYVKYKVDTNLECINCGNLLKEIKPSIFDCSECCFVYVLHTGQYIDNGILYNGTLWPSRYLMDIKIVSSIIPRH